MAIRRPTIQPIRLGNLARPDRILFTICMASIAASLVLGVMPADWMSWSGTIPTDDRPLGPLVSGLVALAGVALAVRVGWTRGRDLGFGRGVGVALGIVISAVSGDQARAFLELAALRDWWGLSSIPSHPDRGLPVFWMLLAGATVLVSFWVGISLVITSAMPRRVTDRWPSVPRTQRRLGNIASWLPVALGLLLVIGHFVLGSELLEALGKLDPDREGAVSAAWPQLIFFGVWPHLASLAFVQFGIGLWSGVEFARYTDKVCTRHQGFASKATTKLVLVVGVLVCLGLSAYLMREHFLPDLTGLASGDDRANTGVLIREFDNPSWVLAVLGALAFAAPLVYFISVVLDDEEDLPGLGLLARLRPDGRARRDDMPLLLVAPVLLLLGGLVSLSFLSTMVGSVTSALRFPLEVHSYFDFWTTAWVTPSFTSLTANDLIGWPLFLLGFLACVLAFWDRTRPIAILVGVPLLGMTVLLHGLGEPSMILLLVAVFALVRWCIYLSAPGASGDPLIETAPALRLAGVGLVALAIALVPDLPVAIPLAIAVIMRFCVTAEDLNEPGPLQSTRALFTISLPVLLSALLLAEHASSGFFVGSALGSIGQSAGIVFVGMPLALGFGVAAEAAARREQAASGLGQDEPTKG